MSKLILVVEDQEDNRRIMRDLLSSVGYEVIEAVTGEEGVAAAETHRPDLILTTTDMAILPGVLGCRTLRRTVQVRLGSNTLRLPGGTPIFAVSRHQCMKHPG